MSKKLDETTMQSELSGSAFFRPAPSVQQDNSPSPQNDARLRPQEPSISPAEPPVGQSPTRHAEDPEIGLPAQDNAQPTAPPPVLSTGRTPVRTRRTITRYAFEFYQDQVESLQKFSLEEKIRGEKGSMSEMVREALDAYVAKRHRVEE